MLSPPSTEVVDLIDIPQDHEPLILEGDVLAILRRLRSGSVQLIFTSPAYWGSIRAYKTTHQVFGGDPLCQHEWSSPVGAKGRDNRNGLGESGLDGTGKYLENLNYGRKGNDNLRDSAPAWSDSSTLKKNDRPGRTEEQRERIIKESPKRFNQPLGPPTSQFCTKCSRDGWPAWKGELGQEPHPDLYVYHLVLIFRECRRVLRDDGTLWVNIADVSIGYKGDEYGETAGNLTASTPSATDLGGRHDVGTPQTSGLRPKNLALIPARLELALYADGWNFRAETFPILTWKKSNPMPMSRDDAPTQNVEYVFMLTKNAAKPLYWVHRDKPIGTRSLPDPDYVYLDKLTQQEQREEPSNWRIERMPPKPDKVGALTGEVVFHDGSAEEERPLRWRRINLWAGHDYFYDEVAIREANSSEEQAQHNQRYAKVYESSDQRRREGGQPGNVNSMGIHSRPGGGGRNARTAYEVEVDESAWTEKYGPGVLDITTKPYKGAHTATFPPELADRPILCGTSEHGACSKCGAPYERMVREERAPDPQVGTHAFRAQGAERDRTGGAANRGDREFEKTVKMETVGWQPTCSCEGANLVPCVVLDIFAGSGTVPMEARRLGRKGVGIELNSAYVAEARERCGASQKALRV